MRTKWINQPGTTVMIEVPCTPEEEAFADAEEAVFLLDQKRSQKLIAIKAEAESRMTAIHPAGLFDNVQLLSLIYSSVTVTPGSNLDRIKDIGVYGKQKYTWAKTATEAELDAYDPVTDPGWPN